MPSRCIAASCSNTSENKNISMHEFPRDPDLKEKWVQQVRRTREGWSPEERSRPVLCSAHFEPECFDPVPAMKMKLGIQVRCKNILLPTAVPTIFPRGSAATKPKKPRASRAQEKRRRLEVLEDCMTSYCEEPEVHPPDSDESSPARTSCDVDVQVCLKPTMVDATFQHRGRGRPKGVQVNLKPVAAEMVSTHTQTKKEDVPSSDDDDDQSMSSEASPEISDSSGSEYVPSSDDDDKDDECTGSTSVNQVPCTPPKHAIFLIFWTCLAELISLWCSCPKCGKRELSFECKEIGTLLQIELTCTDCGHSGKWKSQPFYGKTAAGNILLSAAILFAGATVTKVMRVLGHMGVAITSIRSYFRHQDNILFKAVERVWREEQAGVMFQLRGQGPIVCGGDGRADSPGHCAKYGSYTMMELTQRKVIDIQLVQSNQVGGSYHMEQRGLEDSLAFLQDQDVEIGTMVTDRHVGINKMIRVHHPLIKHLFDIWHVAKSVKKKLNNLAKKTGCQALKPWISSIVNHLYWCVVSTPDDNRDLAVDKWKSVVSHIHNQHDGFTGQFPRCEHGPLEGREQQKPWLLPQTLVSTELENIIFKPKLCSDIKRLSPAHQTSSLEAFHSLIIHFAPKMFAFSNKGMDSRVKLAALHFNENSDRAHRHTQDGQPMYTVHYPKYKKGGYIVRKVLDKPSFGYVTSLMTSVKEICRGQEYNGDILEGLVFAVPEVRPLAAECEKPDKGEAIRAHVTRFSL